MLTSTACFLAILGVFLWIDRLVAYADDGGVSESPNGKITQNSGYPAMSKSARTPGISGDSGTLLSTLQHYQDFYRRKVARGDQLTDTDAEVLKRINQKVRDLKAGETVSANEVESLRRIMQQSNTGGMSGNVNEKVQPPSVWEDLGTAAGNTFEEVARGETPAGMAVRGLTGTLTGGASELVFTPIQAGYGMYDYVQNGGDSALEAFGNEAGKVIIGEATGYVTGKASEGLDNALGINEAKIFNTLDTKLTVHGNEVKVNGETMRVFSEYRNPFDHTPLESNYTSALGQFAFGAKETNNFLIGQLGGKVVEQASNSSAWWGEQSVQVEQNVRDFMRDTTANLTFTSNQETGTATTRAFREGSLAEACHESGLYGF